MRTLAALWQISSGGKSGKGTEILGPTTTFLCAFGMPRPWMVLGQLEEVPGGAEALAPLSPCSIPSVSAGCPLHSRGCFRLPPSPSSRASFQRLFALLTFPQLRAILPASKGLLITLMRSGETKRFCDLKQGWEGGLEGRKHLGLCLCCCVCRKTASPYLYPFSPTFPSSRKKGNVDRRSQMYQTAFKKKFLLPVKRTNRYTKNCQN